MVLPPAELANNWNTWPALKGVAVMLLITSVQPLWVRCARTAAEAGMAPRRTKRCS